MLAREIMIPEPYVAAAGATSAEVALLMRAKDISVVPVVDNPKDRRYLGTISDRDIVDAAAQRELFGRLAPLRPRLRGYELVLRHQIAPLGMEGDQVGDDTLHQGKGTVGFGEGEVLPIPGQ